MKKSTCSAAALLVVANMLLGCASEEAYQKPPRPVRVQAVAEYSGSTGVRYSANIEPYEEVTLAFKVGGYVDRILQRRGAGGRQRAVQKGDRVVKGTVLAQVRQDDYVEKVNQARSQLMGAEAAHERAKLDFDRARNLFASQSLTKSDYDAAKAQLDVAQAKVSGASAQLEEAEIALRDTSLKAPMNALLLGREIEVGTLVDPDTDGFRLADVTSVKAVFGVPDLVVNRLKLGSTLVVTTESARGMQFRGRITAISPSADPSSRVFEVELSIPNERDLLKPGMIATVSLVGLEPQELTQAKATLSVPLTAVVRPPGKSEGYAVYVIENQGGAEIAHLRSVQLGELRGNRVLVLDGIQLGERVIVTGSTLVTDGEQVRVIPGE